MTHQLPCPVCGTPIPLDVDLLLRGVSIKCSHAGCGASVGLAKASAPVLSKAVEGCRSLGKAAR